MGGVRSHGYSVMFVLAKGAKGGPYNFPLHDPEFPNLGSLTQILGQIT